MKKFMCLIFSLSLFAGAFGNEWNFINAPSVQISPFNKPVIK